jgi:predicted O-linked N-acetylglucosamine transferase (SPINDLY family)
VAVGRLVFADRLPNHDHHLARLQLADLFLDTLPFNAHTTASDALWAGLPVITCLGAAFPGRVAASVLKAAGLDELITASFADYEALALKLARDPALLAGLKAKIARNRNSCALFNTDRSRRHIEQAYTMMVERQRRGEPPRSFSIQPK